MLHQITQTRGVITNEANSSDVFSPLDQPSPPEENAKFCIRHQKMLQVFHNIAITRSKKKKKNQTCCLVMIHVR